MNSRLSKSHRKAIEEGKLVESINALDIGTFAAQLCDTTAVSEAEKKFKEKTGKCLELSLLSADALKRDCKDALEACFDLVEESSADDYKASEIKWSSAKKRKEMLLPDMKYLVVHQRSGSEYRTAPGTSICAFVSFMITYEDGYEVIYVYEIHLERHLRGQGVGTVLMQMVESVGRNAWVEKCMLTVFKANQKALKWYKHCGYQIDDFSPGPRVLRNGTIKEPTYLILSKSLKAVLEPQSCAAAQRAS
ncbi:N alpha-acetyl-transferase [Lithohypha guttulata]|uniref:N-alpha-acetyltransferase 40 n=1 Tax=Lithohypha guttulata TaxID=1690604 RepID=A0ABR0KJ00_9EURO|nr:N alpha-acetyl-transferase [Lithohypha guttulata]